jgi:DNA-directed RNA polymerase specialized sigma24 family protein
VLSALATFDQRMSQVVELRFFGGLSVGETAEVLSVSPETVMRDWKTAKAWLLRGQEAFETQDHLMSVAMITALAGHAD